MYPANAHVIRAATDQDVRALLRLASLDSQRPLGGHILIGEIDGVPAAAISLSDGRVVSDPFLHTALLTQSLRMRAAAINAIAETPSLRERISSAVRVARKWRSATDAA
jgi:hypothetical protein